MREEMIADLIIKTMIMIALLIRIATMSTATTVMRTKFTFEVIVLTKAQSQCGVLSIAVVIQFKILNGGILNFFFIS